MNPASRVPPSTTKPSTPRDFSVSADSSPISAMVSSLAWQTTTWPAGAADRNAVHASRLSSRSSPGVRVPVIVHTRPASVGPGSRARISGGSAWSGIPRAARVSNTTPV